MIRIVNRLERVVVHGSTVYGPKDGVVAQDEPYTNQRTDLSRSPGGVSITNDTNNNSLNRLRVSFICLSQTISVKTQPHQELSKSFL